MLSKIEFTLLDSRTVLCINDTVSITDVNAFYAMIKENGIVLRLSLGDEGGNNLCDTIESPRMLGYDVAKT